ncbi:MAG: GHMP kinase [Anaerolineae bacterium]|nr:GHMP kinase [Anaerolineae bacterium]MDW8071569.1 GHMP kinase [Anaerolineae bacterium]
MIITQTPIRVSLFGGGTDFRDYYEREEGCVLSTAIDKYIFVVIKERFDDLIRVGYTRTELVECVDQVQHDLVREALRLTGITRRVEIDTMADIPSEGSGLGSSSAVTVGLLNAMYNYLGEAVTAERLAREACQIEIEMLGRPIGVQDQYIAAYGGLRFMTFMRDGRVRVESVRVDERTRRRLGQNLLLFYTGIARQARDILSEQKNNIADRMAELRAMKQLALTARAALEAGDVDTVGELLHHSWELKKQLASKISNSTIDAMYAAARKAGALGGKITGAGGGGFLLLYCPWQYQEQVRAALSGLRELPFRMEHYGSKVILNYRRYNNE